MNWTKMVSSPDSATAAKRPSSLAYGSQLASSLDDQLAGFAELVMSTSDSRPERMRNLEAGGASVTLAEEDFEAQGGEAEWTAAKRPSSLAYGSQLASSLDDQLAGFAELVMSTSDSRPERMRNLEAGASPIEAQGGEAEWLEPPITKAEWSGGEDLDAGWSEAVSGGKLETFEEFEDFEDSNGAETQQFEGTPTYEAVQDKWLEMKGEEDERDAEAVSEFYGGSLPSEEESGKAVDQCHERWLEEVKKFPEEVRIALLNIQTFGWQHPVAWAITKGIRDAKTLNRIAYFGSNGKSLGYCAPQTAIAKWVWASSTKAVAAFLQNPWPTVFQIGPAPCTKRQIVSSPDKPSVDITGRYYTENPARTYVINQAGVHIEGFASPVRLSVDASKQPEGDHRPLTSFEGEVRGDKIYWFNRDQPQNFGQFSKEGNRLYLGGQLLKPMEQRPTLFMGTDLDSSFDLPTRHELTPLTPGQLAIIRNILNPYWLNKIFAKFHNDGNADAVGDLLRRFLNDPPCWMKHPSVRASCEPRLEQFYEVDLPLVRQYVQLVLTAQIWKNNRNTTLSHVQWIQRMLDVTMGKAPDSAVYQLYKYTGLKRSKSIGTGQHHYEFDFTLNGLSVLLAGYTGTLTVSKKTGPKPWTKQYSIELWGGNVSISLVDVKLHSSFKGAAQSDIEWTENDIPGPLRLARASASIGMDTASAQIGFMHLFGNESIPMLPVYFQDASLGYPNVFKILEEKSKTSIDMDPSAKFTVKGVVGLDVGVSVLFGAISPLNDVLQSITLRKGGYDPVDLSLMPKWDVSTTHNLSAEVHFCFDTDTPTEAARQAIRIMCARELAQLMSPASTLAVVGHADTIGRAEYNKDLSERRARKTVDAIKEILGSKFQIPEAHIKMEGKGEDFAAQESKGRTVAAPKHRRVQVFLNAKLVLTLFSQAKQPGLSVATTLGAGAEWLEPPITKAEWSGGEDLDAGWSEAVSGGKLETFEEFEDFEDSNGAETQQSEGTPTYEWVQDKWLEMRAMESEAATAAAPIQARILWPALGFPAVVSHSERPSATPGGGDATTCICVLVATSSPRLSSADAARCLRYVPWAQRGRPHIAARAFEPGDIAVRSDAGATALTLAGRNDRFGGHIAFGANTAKQHGIVALLAEPVRTFYKNVGLPHLYEIRVSEAATALMREGQYHLFWSNLQDSDDAPSDEMKLLVERFARPRRAKLGKAWDSQRDFLLAEYMYEYGGLHAPYNRTRTRVRAEILHPLFIRARSSAPLTIGHVTDTHVDVRADVYEHNLKAAQITARAKPGHVLNKGGDYNNFNTSFVKIYGEARQTSDILLMTGDLIDYGRGFWGLGRALEVQEDGLYHSDRNWFLFYDLIAAGDAYSTPTYTILGNHDWRLNPYPPFAPGAPNPNELINDHMRLTPAEQHQVIEAAHGDGHKRRFSYSVKAESTWQLFRERTGDSLKALVQLFSQTSNVEQEGFPTETSFESIAWYLLSINPFLDYSFTLPGKQSVLMLDWAKDEAVLFPIVRDGIASGYDPLSPGDAAGTPRPRYSPTHLQQQMLAEFVSGPSRSKIVGVHAPPISPYSDWHTADLVASRKTYSNPDTARGPKGGHPLFAVTPSTHVMTPSGMVADRGSLGDAEGRDWFIRIVSDPKYFVRLVLSGHVHRNGFYVVKRQTAPIEFVQPKDPSQRIRVDNALLVGIPSQTHQGALYITTTSAGPRGSFEKRPLTQEEREHGGTTTDPGFTRLSIGTDGKLTAMLFRGGQAPAEKAPQPKPAQREMAVGI